MRIAIVDERMPSEAKRRLFTEGFYIIEAPRAKALPAPLSSHPDMLFFAHEKTIISSAEYCDENPHFFEDITKLVPGVILKLTDESFYAEYPRDAIFNALVIGDKIFLKEDSVSRKIIEYASDAGLKICSVKQGYPACTTLPLSKNHAITADLGMKKALEKKGVEITLIDNGDISLPPYKYGFIGGASGVFGDKLYFIGDYKLHRDRAKIEAAARAVGLSPISLCSAPLIDLGRIIFIDSDI